MIPGAQSPIDAALGTRPTPAVASPIRVMVTRNVYLRPSRSPKKPNSTAPRGRKPKPTAKPAQASRVWTISLPAGKKVRPMIPEAASVP